MKAVFLEFLILLSICTVRGNIQQINEQRLVQESDKTKFLVKVLFELSTTTRKPFVMIGEKIEVSDPVIEILQQSGLCENVTDSLEKGYNCKLLDNVVMSVRIAQDPTRVYLWVHNGTLRIEVTDEDIRQFCEPTCVPTTCPPKTCPSTICTTTACPSSTQRPRLTCEMCAEKCCSDATSSMTGSSNNSSTEGNGVLPIVIASVVSFIVGAGVCLLVLCLVGHFHGRLFLKFTDSSKYTETSKELNQSPMKNSRDSAMKEHEYLDLQCDTMPHSTTRSQRPSGGTGGSSDTHKPSDTATAPEYESITEHNTDRVYSGFRNSNSNPSNVYDTTSPNRTSEHMYSGISHGTQHQPVSANVPGGTSYTNDGYTQDSHNVANDNLIPDNRVEGSEYFVLEKEQHSSNPPASSPESDHKLDNTGASIARNSDDSHLYHILQKQ